MDDTETSVDEEPEAEPDLDARVKPEPVRPSVHGNTLSAQPAPPPRRSPWRIFVYVFVFACLVAVSLVLRTSNGSGKNPSPSSTPSGNVILPGKTASPSSGGGAIIDTPFADTSCHRADVLQSGFTLVAGFTSNAGTTAAWEDALSQGSQTSPLHELSPDLKVAVCYIDGPWQPPQNVADLYKSMGVVADRAIVVVPETGTTVYTAPIAPHDSLPILQPASPAASAHT